MRRSKKEQRKQFFSTTDIHKSNRYCLKCMNVATIVFCIAWVLNILNIFIVDQAIMNTGFVGTLIFWGLGHLVKRTVGLDKKVSSYLIMFLLVAMLSYANVMIAYHGTLFMLLPMICSVLFYDDFFTAYTFVLTVIGFCVSVVLGFHIGLCDANMLLLTTTFTARFMEDVRTGNVAFNSSVVNLLLFFAFPRCMALVAFTSILQYIKSDIQDKTRKEMESRHLAEEAKVASQAKSAFLANMSHEIRTPINAVLGLDTMILRESSESHIRSYAMDIQNAGQSLLDLINDILDFSKIESGKMELVENDYDFGKMLQDVTTMISYKAQNKNLKLSLYLNENLPSVLHGDDVRIRQILVNLLNNAVKYTHKGEVSLSVDGEVENGEVLLHFCVKDTGIGIKKEDIPKLFAQYERIEEGRNRKIEGTGLGISITTNLLHLMNSKLQVESEYGVGSNFSFDLRQKIVKTDSVGKTPQRTKEEAKNYKYKVSFTAPEAKILVVDDDAMNRKVFCALLKKTEIKIDVAESGMQCIEMCGRIKYNIIFLDHMMPEMDGCETLHKMKEIPDYLNSETPVIILTANAISGAREQFLQEGFDEYLSKPIVQDRLEKTVRDFLPGELINEM